MHDAPLSHPARIVQGLALLGLAYRATLYWRVPVAPGDAHGLVDVIDLGLGVVLFLTCSIGGLLALSGLIYPRLLGATQGVRLMLACLASFGAYWLLHPHMPRLIGP